MELVNFVMRFLKLPYLALELLKGRLISIKHYIVGKIMANQGTTFLLMYVFLVLSLSAFGIFFQTQMPQVYQNVNTSFIDIDLIGRN